MEVGGGFPVSEAWHHMGWLFEGSEALAHGTPDDGVRLELDGDILCLHDLSLMSHMDRDKIGGYIDPEALGAFVRGVGVHGGLS